ncbi:MAG: hypothetical protein RLZZ528_2147 [Pseudomonadota bacterium]|jgi:OOP family OmpA-OmpF porin
MAERRRIPGWSGLAVAVWAAGALAGGTARALDLPEGARLAAEQVAAEARVLLPSGPRTGAEAASLQAEGRVRQRAWQVAGDGAGAFALFARLRDGLVAEGFAPVFDCSTQACGGFDFRHALDLLPEPGMHVDLGEFHYLLAEKGGGDATVRVALIVSRAPERLFVQETRVEPRAAATALPAQGDVPEGTQGEAAADAATDAATGPGADIAAVLTAEGRVALDDLVFASGTAELGPGRFASLAALAGFLEGNPGTRIVLVGHTDATGALDANIALSRRRAQSVAERLVADYGADGTRIGAEGAGYLAPRASNLTEAGRQKNRRVEAMLAPTRP